MGYLILLECYWDEEKELGAIETVGLNSGLVDGAVDKLGSAVGLSDGVIVGIVVFATCVGFDELMRVICKGFSTFMLWLNEQINIPCMFSMALTLAVGTLSLVIPVLFCTAKPAVPMPRVLHDKPRC